MHLFTKLVLLFFKIKLILATDKVDLLATKGEASWTVLHSAVDSKSLGVVRQLLQFPSVDKISSSLAEKSLSQSQIRKLWTLLCQPTNSSVGSTPLHMSVKQNNIQLAATLLEAANWFQKMMTLKSTQSADQSKRRRCSLSSDSLSSDLEDEDSDNDALYKNDDEEDEQEILVDAEWKASAKLTRLKDKYGDTALHWAIKANK